MTIPHKSFPKIPRLEDIEMRITEKLDGTNAVIYVSDDKLDPSKDTFQMRFGSRNRWCGDYDDNQEFYSFCMENIEYLKRLPPGYHYGEFIGPKIQGNRYELQEKQLYLFDTRLSEMFTDTTLINTIPVLLKSTGLHCIQDILDYYQDMNSRLNPKAKAEGVILFIPKLNQRIKIIFDK